MSFTNLIKKPTLMTALLSAAALLSYAGYRLALIGPSPESPLAAGLPDIVLDDLAGTPTPLRNWSGQPLLVNFWATWCAPCLREIPLLKQFHDGHASITVIGIAVEQPEPVLEFAGEMQFNYPVLVGYADGYDAMAQFQNDAQAMPFSVFVAADGAVLGKHYGELAHDDLEHFAATVEQLESGAIGREQARERLAAMPRAN